MGKLIAAELFGRSTNKNDILSKIITGDETRVYAYDPETFRKNAYNSVSYARDCGERETNIESR